MGKALLQRGHLPLQPLQLDAPPRLLLRLQALSQPVAQHLQLRLQLHHLRHGHAVLALQDLQARRLLHRGLRVELGGGADLGLRVEVCPPVQAAQGGGSLAEAEDLLVLLVQGALGVLQLRLGLLQTDTERLHNQATPGNLH
ncbi:hypothetical protein EYF80_044462 [Liparis tanakae]|uniref:Uncharacterized protein n=1 Tax=Liparis tanakae TaxID=230148 RepID=A0A4Z2FWM7_9TELE|nr:hypothetical protein EYF80_044462 [Liparis tanakae]